MQSQCLYDHYADMICEQLTQGQPVMLRARGQSMWPFIRDFDQVTIKPIFQPVYVGEVVCVRHGNTIYLHRVADIADDGEVLTWGDALPAADGWRPATSVVGVVSAVRRNGKRVLIFQGLGPFMAARVLSLGRRQIKRIKRARLGIFRFLGHHGRHE